MKRLIDYFQLNQKEQKGIFVLLVLLLFLIVLKMMMPFWRSPESLSYTLVFSEESKDERGDFADDGLGYMDKEDQFHNYSDSLNKDFEPSKEGFGKKMIPHYFFFDPNHLSKEGWVKLGLSPDQAKVIINYRKKGGRFRKVEDLSRMYSISESKFKELLPFVRIAEEEIGSGGFHQKPSSGSQEEYSFVRKKEPLYKISLNEADTTGWMQVRGIGPVFSSRIVKFRNALGGFHKKEQLMEDYGMTPELFQKIEEQLLDQPLAYDKIFINRIGIDSLAKHPYIRYKKARTIVNYRIQHGPFEKIEDLGNILILDLDFLRKIEPYLDFARDL
ncbi:MULTISPECIES: ComEA family DNA-binding protein [Sphingobacterium]|uniref:Helix-hairpin-helix domain-containing protein n=1 Tax=Sphingobacterium tenebrionis TaxID=3111775 RepID=A0ABU8I6I4_9SPHI|nr:helix-hairpin-helix domain-containing protein [Sphingobacterium sp. 1.A.4]